MVPGKVTTMGEPVWALATRLPEQGDWSEEDYLAFAGEQRRLELSDGAVELLPMPTKRHQAALRALLFLLDAYARRVGGTSSFAGMRVRLRHGRFREPDLMFLTGERRHLAGEEYWSAADLVMEVVSGGPEDRVRDLVKKRREYAEAAILEYWIVDPEAEAITVLRLDGGAYVEHGPYLRGSVARSQAFEGLSADVAAVFDAD